MVGLDGIGVNGFTPGYVGNQTSWGYLNGKFYYEGSRNSESPSYGCGGGDGYYGGGMDANVISSAGGGSYFISGYPGCTINSSFSNYVFYKTEMKTNIPSESKVIITMHSIIF